MSCRTSGNAIIAVVGAMYASLSNLGYVQGISVLSVHFAERPVFYRERAAGLYSPWAYALAQVYVMLS